MQKFDFMKKSYHDSLISRKAFSIINASDVELHSIFLVGNYTFNNKLVNNNLTRFMLLTLLHQQLILLIDKFILSPYLLYLLLLSKLLSLLLLNLSLSAPAFGFFLKYKCCFALDSYKRVRISIQTEKEFSIPGLLTR